jgi:signal transduction histidine kinase
LEPSLRESGIQLALDLDPDLPLIMFDVLHMRQVILNLAKNGLEAMGEGGTLTISTKKQPEGVVAVFADTGEGIPPDTLDKIFQPFYSTKPKGSGLGLAISQKIIEAHHGRITIESEPEKGTRVQLFLRAELPES